MALAHLRVLLCELEHIDESISLPSPFYFDYKSAIAVNGNYAMIPSHWRWYFIWEAPHELD
jgi:hypothetical protein